VVVPKEGSSEERWSRLSRSSTPGVSGVAGTFYGLVLRLLSGEVRGEGRGEARGDARGV